MIHTIDSKGNILLSVIEKHLGLGSVEMNNAINSHFNELKKVFTYKGIDYDKLKNSLIPQKDRKEILLVFDSRRVEESFYGGKIMGEILNHFDNNSIHSVKSGDFIDVSHGSSINLLELMKQYIKIPRSVTYCGDLFLVYINNLSETQFNKFVSVSEKILSCIGSVDLTYSSLLKDYCSCILCGDYIKYNNKIIVPHEDDRDYKENVNLRGYPFEIEGYKVLSIPECLFGVFLSYKIESNIGGADKIDVHFSITSISYDIADISKFDVLIDEKKLEYLKSEKEGSLKRLDYLNVSKSELETFIKSKIQSSYLYNLTYLDDYNVSKFNVLLELVDLHKKPYKVVVSLEYRYNEKKLRVITLY